LRCNAKIHQNPDVKAGSSFLQEAHPNSFDKAQLPHVVLIQGTLIRFV